MKAGWAQRRIHGPVARRRLPQQSGLCGSTDTCRCRLMPPSPRRTIRTTYRVPYTTRARPADRVPGRRARNRAARRSRKINRP